MKSYLSVPKVYSVKLRVIAVDAGGGGAKSHRGTPSRGLEWAGFEAAPATDPTGRRTVHFTKTFFFYHRDLRMTPVYVTSDISRWREYNASGVGCY